MIAFIIIAATAAALMSITLFIDIATNGKYDLVYHLFPWIMTAFVGTLVVTVWLS